MSAYHIWNPYVSPGNPRVMDFVLTNADVPSGLPRSKELVSNVLKDLGMDAEISRWTIEPFRSMYYSEYLDGEDWRGGWPIVWKVHVESKAAFGTLPKRKAPWIETNATSEAFAEEVDEAEKVGCLVVSDFKSESVRDKAQAAIESPRSQGLRVRYHVGTPKFTRSRIMSKYEQLQIDLGSFPSEFFEHGADYAEAVMDLCKKHKGTVHFKARLK